MGAGGGGGSGPGGEDVAVSDGGGATAVTGAGGSGVGVGFGVGAAAGSGGSADSDAGGQHDGHLAGGRPLRLDEGASPRLERGTLLRRGDTEAGRGLQGPDRLLALLEKEEGLGEA